MSHYHSFKSQAKRSLSRRYRGMKSAPRFVSFLGSREIAPQSPEIAPPSPEIALFLRYLSWHQGTLGRCPRCTSGDGRLQLPLLRRVPAFGLEGLRRLGVGSSSTDNVFSRNVSFAFKEMENWLGNCKQGILGGYSALLLSGHTAKLTWNQYLNTISLIAWAATGSFTSSFS